jgi:hypothetical protein
VKQTRSAYSSLVSKLRMMGNTPSLSRCWVLVWTFGRSCLITRSRPKDEVKAENVPVLNVLFEDGCESRECMVWGGRRLVR